MWTFYTPCVSVAVSGDFCHETARKCTFLKYTCLAFQLFAMNATPARRVTPPWDVYMANCHPGWQGYPTWQKGQPALAGYPTYHVNVIKIKWEIIWKGGLPHLSGLPHLPGVLRLHVNWPLIASATTTSRNLTPAPRDCKIARKRFLIFRTRLGGLPHLPWVPHLHVNRP